MRRGRRAVARTAAVVLLAAFAALLAVPLLHAADEVRGPYCAGDRCCCAPAPGDVTTRLRSVCRCGLAAGEAALVSLGESVLPAPVMIPRVEPLRLQAPRTPPLPPSPPLSPPQHPPPSA